MEIDNGLTLYDLLKAQVIAGAVVYKVCDHVPCSDGIVRIDATPNPITLEYPYPCLFVMTAQMCAYFLRICKERNITAIPIEVFNVAECMKFGKEKNNVEYGLESEDISTFDYDVSG